MSLSTPEVKSNTSPVILRFRRPDGWVVAALVIAGIVATPVAVVMAGLLVPAGAVWKHLASTVLSGYITNTLMLMGGVGVGTLLIGVSTAWLVTMCRFPGRAVFEWALLLPLAMPTYAIAFTYGSLFEFSGPVQSTLREVFAWGRDDYWFPDIRSVGGAILVMTVVLYPYVYLLTRAAFLNQSVCVLEVSRTLGRGRWHSFVDVALPLARPAIVGGLALVLMETLGDFGAVEYLAVATFTTGIFRTWFGLGEPIAAAQLSAVLLLFVLALILFEQSSRGGRKFHHTSRRYRALPRYQLGLRAAGGAFLACFTPIFLGFLLPGGQLAAWTIETAPRVVDEVFLALAMNSVMLATTTAIIAVAAALLLAYGCRLRPGPLITGASRVASMGYAIPGAVIAVGVLIPFAWLDNRFDGMMREIFGLSSGLILSGTPVALIFGYLVRFLAVSFNTVESGLGKATPAMDDAARTLGLGPGATLARVHMPLISGSLLTAALLVFVDVMKELPATLIMRPFNFNTLAVRAFELAENEQLAESAPAALSIVGFGILPVILLTLAIARSRPGDRADFRFLAG